MVSKLESLKAIVEKSSNIVFFGGAGVSTESSIPDFRSETGMYNTKSSFSYLPEVMLSHTFFMEHTREFYKFYKAKMIYRDAKPNNAHIALAELEKRGKLKAVITQNIDNLHQQAGSQNVIELHGSVYRNHCMDCGRFFTLDYILDSGCDIPRCSSCNGIVKPDVVLYEEELDMNTINRAVRCISASDVLIIGGTSLAVYPAAGLVQYYRGKKLILINKSVTSYDSMACLSISESIGKVLGSLL